MTNTEMERYDYIVECGLATADELNLAFNMTPNDWTWTLDRVIYIRTGYNDFEQWVTAEDEE